MPKDYKDAPAPRGDSRVSHPLLLGMIIGLLMGIVISLAVALWLNRLSNPFMEKGKPQQSEAPAKLGVPQAAPPPEAARAAAEAAKAAKASEEAKPGKAAKAERPRFEFYQILPGEKEAPDKDARPAPPKVASAPPAAPAPAPAPPKPGSSPASPKAHSGETYWLQAGAFAEEKEADNLKAKIAFTGLEASVRAVDIPSKGKLFRVRLGPYQSLDDANRIKGALAQNGVGAAIIRTTDEPKNP
ncbi:MAG TPA: SPOR domain-containing protein [Usitatibacter sp.]|nr:SPOR domain-containing protein [Usitatibacter sp.]